MENISNKNEESLLEEICEISNNLCDIRKQINTEQLTILRYENLLKERINILNQLNEVKSNLKQKRNEFLQKISHDSGTESESDMCITNAAFKLSGLSNHKSIISDTNYSFDTSNNILSNHSHSLKNTNNSNKGTALIINEPINTNKNVRKLKNTNQILSTKKRKLEDLKPMKHIEKQKIETKYNPILEITTRELFCVAYISNSGILLGGSLGLLQLRDQRSMLLIRSYKGHGNETVERIIIVEKYNRSLIGSCSKRKFIAFDLRSGKVLHTVEFKTDIVCLKRLKNSLIIASRCGTFSLLKLKTLQLESEIESVDDLVTVFDATVPSKSTFGLVSASGAVYTKTMSNNEVNKVSRELDKNVIDVLALPGKMHWLTYTDNTIKLFNDEDQFEKSFNEKIRKVFLFNYTLFILLANGAVLKYMILNSDWYLESYETLHTHDSTVRDICGVDSKVYVIGDHNVYCLK